METKKVDIDIDVHREIEKKRRSFEETPNEILRRIFGLSTEKQTKEGVLQGGGLATKGVVLPNGLRLSSTYKGRKVDAVIRNGKIDYNGKYYNSPSAAAVAVTGNPVNGWRFWLFFDAASNSWKPLNILRN